MTFESNEQLTYVATCLAASNLGFDINSNLWPGAQDCKKRIQSSKTYREKTLVIVYTIANLSEDDVDMERAILEEQKHWTSFLKENNKPHPFNPDIIKYINIAEGK